MTVYEFTVRAKCPVNPKVYDLYIFAIMADAMIEVEKIHAFFNKHTEKQVFQEVLTQQCAVALGVRVISVGKHSGVKVTCEAP